ncbi:hypothetical protein DXU92_05010 [Brachybacterium saurashtrense]|uniref:S-layer homology domain-containing protein n=1 Tax=Brachybacterium saurashtrense TaxID=556288 RepID=A0A345YRD3_9MICO|nr:hypothetical protein DWV08_13260 [Brachybacterium saurashtrense]RRR24226.1 hypothetical protein DXU92_05010 [Brachybacterium saurashtrense]
MRRPPAPHLRTGRPGAMPSTPSVPDLAPGAGPSTPSAPAPVAEPAAPRTAEPVPPQAPAAPAPAPLLPPATDTAHAPDPTPIPAGPPAPAASRPSHALTRRTVLAGSAALAAVGLPVTALVVADPDAAPVADAVRGADTADTAHSATAPDDALEALRWADAIGVLPAREDGSFAAQATLTRGDLALALHRFVGAPAVPADAVPTMLADLDEDPERRDALLWLFGHGALWGDDALCVHPQEPASREGAAEILTAMLRPSLRAAGIAPDQVDAELDVPEGAADSAAAWIVRAGLVPSALSDLPGEATVTRGELAQLLRRADQVLSDAVDPA